MSNIIIIDCREATKQEVSELLKLLKSQKIWHRPKGGSGLVGDAEEKDCILITQSSIDNEVRWVWRGVKHCHSKIITIEQYKKL